MLRPVTVPTMTVSWPLQAAVPEGRAEAHDDFGIDTGKRKLDVALDGSTARLQNANTANGHAELSAWLRRHRVKRIGIAPGAEEGG